MAETEQKRKLDQVILWADESDESKTAAELLNAAGVDFILKDPNIDPPNVPLEPPVLQTYYSRYGGINIIQILATTHMPGFALEERIRQEKEAYMRMVEIEDQILGNTPFSFLGYWPPWSVRQR